MAWRILGIPPCKRSLPRWRSSNTHLNLNAVHNKLGPGIGTSPYVYLSGMSTAKHFSNIDFFVSLVFARANTIYIFTFLPFCHKLLLPYLQEEGRRQKLILYPFRWWSTPVPPSSVTDLPSVICHDGWSQGGPLLVLLTGSRTLWSL